MPAWTRRLTIASVPATLMSGSHNRAPNYLPASPSVPPKVAGLIPGPEGRPVIRSSSTRGTVPAASSPAPSTPRVSRNPGPCNVVPRSVPS
jgi:hypothetical protein